MTARQTAANLAPGEPVPWRSVERAAFEDFPEVVSRLRSSVGDGSSSRKFIHFRPLWLLGVGIYGTPLYGLVTVLGPRGLSQTSRTAQGDITVAGFIFGIAFVLLLLYSGLWLWKGRPPKAAFGGYAAMAFFMGGISVFVAARRGIENSVPAWELWSLPMLACTVIGGIFFFLVRRARRQAPIMAEPVQHERGGGESPAHNEAVCESINRVTNEDQRLIRGDLAAAIDDLQRRGVITATDARHARSAELGGLAGHMAQLRSSV